MIHKAALRTALTLLCAILVMLPALHRDATAQVHRLKGKELAFREGLAARGPRSERNPVVADPIGYLYATNRFTAPTEGAELGGMAEGSSKWQRVTAGDDGYFTGEAMRGAYLYVSVEAPRAATMILEASGQSMVYVNGVPRAGDVYDYGWIRHPVALRRGRNDFVFQVGRGRVKARLVAPEAPLSLTTLDPTLPDLIVGEQEDLWGALRVVNATDAARRDLALRVQAPGRTTLTTDVPVVERMTSRKVGFRIPPAPPGAAHGAKVPLTVELIARERRGERVLSTATVELDVVGADRHQRRTFISEIDGSVQYYMIVPGGREEGKKPALFLSLHGASVEAVNQARAYKAKDWGHIVAPTNRRPYGFDWEDWGRLDALEVLALASARLEHDPMRVFLTGHSMGGHGTWHVGATHPDRFAAIAPSCGWYSFWSYAMRMPENPSAVQQAVLRASNASQTLGISRNYMNHGVYILHGQIDETVPVGQARFMKQHLAAFHPDFSYYEVPGAGHWWGDESVDFKPIFDYFRWHRRKDVEAVDTLRFTTASPGISSTAYWLTVYEQQRPMEFSTATIVRDTAKATYSGTTENIALLAIDLGKLVSRDTVSLVLDGTALTLPAKGSRLARVWLRRDGGAWRFDAQPALSQKGPHRYGTFKYAFQHRMIFVYGTKGTPEENAWAYDKARYDAEAFWYRGNGSVDVVPDVEFDPSAEPDRGVILYGNAETNGAWQALLADSPVQVRRGEIRVGDRTLRGDDLAVNFVRPRPGSNVASVGIIAGTGLPGMKAAYPNTYFMAGAGYPDLFLYSAEMLRSRDAGVRSIGYFGTDWSVERGDFTWF